jgi:hypothetical protein
VVLPPVANSQAEQLAAARKLLEKLLSLPNLRESIDTEARPTSRMVYTHGVTLWMLILQRLGGGATLSDLVTHVLEHGRDIFPENKRVREGSLSENTASYSHARKRLPLSVVEAFSREVCDHLGRTAERVFDGRRVFIIDGTTITLAPTPALCKAFPPATNQHGESVWPVAMLMVASELQSGCVLLPQVDPMYGPNNSSEADQGRRIVQQLPENSVVLADSGFGIFSVAYHSKRSGHDFLFRLSMSRYKALRKQAPLVDQGEGYKTYQLTWRPSVKDRKSSPELPEDAAVEVFVHEVELVGGTKLAMVSSLEIDASSAAELYCRRYDVEFDIRDVKVTMDTENIRAKSVEIVQKELMTSVVAYNLTAQFRRQAAKLAKVNPRRLSFSGVWTSFREILLYGQSKTFDEWIVTYTRALISASKRLLPNRNTPRSYPRVAHPRRPKTTKFQKSLRRKKKESTEESPPNQL